VLLDILAFLLAWLLGVKNEMGRVEVLGYIEKKGHVPWYKTLDAPRSFSPSFESVHVDFCWCVEKNGRKKPFG